MSALCPGCFERDTPSSGDACPQCGYSDDQERSPLALPIGTELQSRYQVGRVLGEPGGFAAGPRPSVAMLVEQGVDVPAPAVVVFVQEHLGRRAAGIHHLEQVGEEDALVLIAGVAAIEAAQAVLGDG